MEYKYIIDCPLSKDQIDQLDQVIRGNDPYHVRNCAQAILLLFKEHRTYEDVAAISRVHVNTIRNWAERWVAYGIDGLYYFSGRGAKPRFSRAEEIIILQCLEETPRSIRRVADTVEQKTGKRASIEIIRRVLKKHGKSWKRQRKTPKGKPSDSEYQQGQADLEELKQLAQDGEFDLLYFDASGFSLTPEVPYAWQDLGRDGTLGIPTSRSKRINVLGFMNPAINTLAVFEYTDTINSAAIITAIDTFCDDLTHPTVVILDNASVHTSAAVTAKRAEWERRGVTLYFIPPYSPQLNLIEILWRKIKYEWLPNAAYTSMASLKKALMEIFESFGSEYKIQFAS